MSQIKTFTSYHLLLHRDYRHHQETSISCQSWPPQSTASLNSTKTNFLRRIGSRCISSWTSIIEMAKRAAVNPQTKTTLPAVLIMMILVKYTIKMIMINLTMKIMKCPRPHLPQQRMPRSSWITMSRPTPMLATIWWHSPSPSPSPPPPPPPMYPPPHQLHWYNWIGIDLWISPPAWTSLQVLWVESQKTAGGGYYDAMIGGHYGPCN